MQEDASTSETNQKSIAILRCEFRTEQLPARYPTRSMLAHFGDRIRQAPRKSKLGGSDLSR